MATAAVNLAPDSGMDINPVCFLLSMRKQFSIVISTKCVNSDMDE